MTTHTTTATPPTGSPAAPTGSSPAARPPLYKYQTMQWDGSDFGEDWESLSDADVQGLLAAIYPELGNARAKVETVGAGDEARRVVTFERSIGTKGVGVPVAPASRALAGRDEKLAERAPTAFADPRPALLWDAMASLPPLELRAYELAYDMQHLTLDEMVAKGDTLERAVEEAEREIEAVSDLTRLLIPAARHARNAR